MSGAISLGQLSYASFYLPSLAFGYLSIKENNSLLPYLTQVQFQLPIQGLKPIHVFWFLTAFTFLGAMETHGVARAIYGPNGPTERPKDKTVQIRHTLAITLGADVEEIPILACRLWKKGLITGIPMELAKDLAQGRSRVILGITQWREIGLMVLNREKIARVMYFIPMGLLQFWGRVAFLALGTAIYLGAGTYAAFVLFAALFVLLFRNLIWAPIPPVFNSAALDDRFDPEYKIHNESGDKKSEQRIRTE
ncbi:hypothetical protein [Halomicrobium salinisoli]|uniref:hypothetical protein n=1 Tax=Halomicrobium salinisoli TaxID=2878391 RepID=UPI001CEFE181|nr:hypothetical protein [Halomicrobium salinisoli]